MARTAVVAGTATAVSNRVSRRQARRWGAQDEGYYEEPPQQQQAYAPPPPPPADDAGPDRIEQLRELAKLHTDGILTDEEFEAEKGKILNS
jgi:hypothetical protein